MNSDNLWLANLNQQQRESVQHTEGPLLILAGAGSGKTTVLVSRTGYLLNKGLAKPSEVLVLTFTNKAAKELKERVSQKLGPSSRKVWAGTFHSWGLEFLKKNAKLADLPQKFGLLDATDARALIKELLKERSHFASNSVDIDLLQNLIGLLRCGKPLSPATSEIYKDMAEWLLPAYLRKLHSLGLVDFDGLILRPTEVLRANPEIKKKYQETYKYLMVDEFQDTNKIQMDLVLELVNDRQNIAVVGDDDQSIYGWRGAEIQNILGFPKLFKNCAVVRLETNYRSTPQILNMANSIIQKNVSRHKKQLVPHQKSSSGSQPELFVFDHEESECEEITQLIHDYLRKGRKKNEIAVLFRSNSQGALLEGYLKRANIDYEMTGGPSLTDRKEVRDVLAYLRSTLQPNDISLRRILNTPNRGIGDQSIQKVIDFQKEHEMSFLKAIAQWQKAGVNEKTGQHIDGFINYLRELRHYFLNSEKAFEALLPELFSVLGYKEQVLKSYKDKGTALRKWGLVEIIGRIIDSFIEKSGRSEKTLREFLESMDLRDSDTKKDDVEKVQLLTLHASKGLEYPVVFLMGVDEGLLPHENLGKDIDEERRLFYVGVTRAQQELLITRSRKRKRYGKWRDVSPSRFLCEVPGELMTAYENGVRPLSEDKRTSLLADLYAKLEKDIESRKEI